MKKSILISFVSFLSIQQLSASSVIIDEFLKAKQHSVLHYQSNGPCTIGTNINIEKDYPIGGVLRTLIATLIKKYLSRVEQQQYTLVWKEYVKVEDAKETLLKYIATENPFVAIKNIDTQKVIFFIREQKRDQEPQLLIYLENKGSLHNTISYE